VTQQLYVDKTTGTFADQLTAMGLAVLCHDALSRAHASQQTDVIIEDRGPYYVLDLSHPLDDAALSRLDEPYMPIKVIVTAKNTESMPLDLPEQHTVVYERERDRRQEYLAVLNSLSAEERRAVRNNTASEAVRARLDGLEPHRDWDIFRAINPAALIGYNRLVVQWWQVRDAFPQVMRLVRDLFARTPNDLGAAEAAWKAVDKEKGWGIKPNATAGQLFNPSQGKGQNRPKPDRLSMGNVDGFWLVEWLKAVGFYCAALTKQLRGSKDRKTYVLAPIALSLREHDNVFNRFRHAMNRAETAVRSDVLASLRYTMELIRYAIAEGSGGLLARMLRAKSPRHVVAGFGSAFYKNLGNSAATMNLPFIGLPGWLRISSREDVSAALAVLLEHERIVQQFDESHSDEYELLLTYRDFCSGDDLEAFFAFTTSYSAFIIGRRERRRPARQFTTENLRRLIMTNDERLAPILESQGFQNIAYAIRQSTVTAQFRKQLGDRRYDVRYGLGQQLARKSYDSRVFIAELTDFLHKYNAENAQVMETRPGPYRRSIQVSDIDDIVKLVDTYGARTICNLLVAYGYARTGSSGEEETESDEATIVGEDADSFGDAESGDEDA
jgi:hypothetical protein